MAENVSPDESSNDGVETSDYISSVRRELRRERRRSLLAFVLGGAFVVATLGAAVGPSDGWDGTGWLPRVGFTTMCAVGGAVAGFRIWFLTEKDD